MKAVFVLGVLFGVLALSYACDKDSECPEDQKCCNNQCFANIDKCCGSNGCPASTECCLASDVHSPACCGKNEQCCVKWGGNWCCGKDKSCGDWHSDCK